MSELLASIAPAWLESARLGRTWPMFSVKEALAPLPPAEAFAAFREALGRPAAELSRKLLEGTRSFAEREATVFREIEPAGERFTNQPPRVIGEGDQRVIAHSKRSSYLAAFDHVAIRGRSQLIELPDRLLLDYEGEEFARIDDAIELDGAVFRRDGDSAWVLVEPSADTIEVAECFSLLGPNSFAFGHWIVEYLPRLWTAMQAGLAPGVPVLIDQGMNRQHRQALEMLLPAGTSIIEVGAWQRVEVGRLWFAPTYFYAPVYPQFNERFRYDLVAAPPDRFRDIFQGMGHRLAANDAPARADSRLFLARRPARHRKMVNHVEIEQLAADRGYRIVYLEDFDFREQLALVRGADRLVGPEGSAFFMAFFARPGTRVGILNHPHTEFLTEVTALLESVGVDCTVLTGPFHRIEDGGYTHFSDYTIDPESFGRFLHDW